MAFFEVASADGSAVATVHAPHDLVDGETVRAVAGALALPGIHHVRLMPDCHVGHGCVVGLTARLSDKWWRDGLVPHIIGSDIGCGMAAVALPPSVRLDKTRKAEAFEADMVRAVPRGAALHPAFEAHELPITDATIDAYLAPALVEAQATADALAKTLPKALARLKPTYSAAWVRALCVRVGATVEDDVLRSLGTLGGGNHYIEVGELVEVGDHAALKAQEATRKAGMYAALLAWWRAGSVRRPRHRFTERAGTDKIQAAYRAACDKLGVPPLLAPLAPTEVEVEAEDEVEDEAEKEDQDEDGDEEPARAPKRSRAKRLGEDEGLPFRLLIAHSGSRHLGHCIAVAHGNVAAKPESGGKLTGEAAVAYAFDVVLATALAKMNRALILRQVLREAGLPFALAGVIDNVHNAIEWPTLTVRKGAVPAHDGQAALVALNMRDGVLLCHGLGAADWNESTAHGCGRALSRTLASRKVTMEAYKRAMKDVVSTSVRPETLDEAPQAYKDKDDVQLAIAPSVLVRGRYAARINVKGW